MPKRRTPLAFTITITPRPFGGWEVITDPYDQMIEQTIEEVVRGRVSLRSDRSTVITATVATAVGGPWSNGPIAPTHTRRGMLQLAQVGAEHLRRADCIVTGYLYDTVVATVLASMHSRGLVPASPIVLDLDDGPIPQFRTATHSWWRDVGHVVVARDGGATVRLRGIPRADPFSTWGNARILSAFRPRLASALGVPVSALAIRSPLQAV